MISIQTDYNLKPINTFGIAAQTKFFCRASSLAELQEALSFASEKEIPVLILGGGSNLLFTQDWPGLTIQVRNTGIQLIEETKDEVLVEVAAGENWHQFVLETLRRGWFGLENLSLIPGSVGAAPMQNIGAYGAEVRQTITEVQIWNREDHKLEWISNEECQFGYRESTFKQARKDKAVVWAVRFRLSKKPAVKTSYGDIQKVLLEKGIENPDPSMVSQAVIEIRQSKLPDPAVLGNAGSFFKNPVISESQAEALRNAFPDIPLYPAEPGFKKVAAGWLIEKAGWKGQSRGTHGVHERQALVLVNYGGATGAEIHQLAKDIQADVRSRFGIELQMEVNRI